MARYGNVRATIRAPDASAICTGLRDQSLASNGVLVRGGLSQCILCRIHYETPVVFAPHQFDRGKWHGYFLLADAKKTADIDECGGNGAVGRHDQIADGSDLLASPIVHPTVQVRTRRDAIFRRSHEKDDPIPRRPSPLLCQ